MAIQQKARECHKSEWNSTIRLRHSKKFIGNEVTGWNNKIWRRGRKQIRGLAGVFTGHFGVKEHLAKMRLTDNPTCRPCKEQPETMAHLLCDCLSMAHRRMSHLGVAFPTPEKYRLFPLGSITSFIETIEPPE